MSVQLGIDVVSIVVRAGENMRVLASVTLVLFLCGMWYQPATGAAPKLLWSKWIVVNTISVGQGAYAVVKTYNECLKQEFTSILRPGDVGYYWMRPTNISVYHVATNNLLYSAPGSGTNGGLIVLRYQDGIGVFADPLRLDNPITGRIYLVNAAPNPGTYHVGYVVGAPFCRVDTGYIRHGETVRIETGLCITHNLHAWYHIGGRTIHTNQYRGRTGGGIFVFRKSAVDPNGFQVTGPWKLSGRE